MEFLRNIRKKNQLTLEEMAAAIGISKPFYWQIENGKRKLTYSMALKIASIFNLKPDDIFYEYFKTKDWNLGYFLGINMFNSIWSFTKSIFEALAYIPLFNLNSSRLIDILSSFGFIFTHAGIL